MSATILDDAYRLLGVGPRSDMRMVRNRYQSQTSRLEAAYRMIVDHRKNSRTKHLVIDLEVPLEDIYNGATRQIQTPVVTVCPQCNGNGCDPCLKKGVVSKQQEHVVRITRGVPDGKRIVVKGYIDQHKQRQSRDLIVYVHEKSGHPVFRRKGLDLYTTVDISLHQALTTPVLTLTHLDGRTLYFQWKTPLRAFDQVHRIHGLGMIRGERRGDLYMAYRVLLPENGNHLRTLLGDLEETVVVPDGQMVHRI